MSASIRIFRGANQSICRSCLYQQRRTVSDLPAPPLLLKLRGDMKQAMKDKDKNRLAVLRSVLADATNAAKTSNPMKTDLQLLSLLRKRAQASKDAAAQFQGANRSDLADNEKAQVGILEEYASGVETMGQDDIKKTVQEVIGALRTEGQVSNAGMVLKELFKPGGAMEGKPVDKAEVAVIVKGML